MPLDIVRGRISNVMATKELIPIIEKLNAQNDATLYLGIRYDKLRKLKNR